MQPDFIQVPMENIFEYAGFATADLKKGFAMLRIGAYIGAAYEERKVSVPIYRELQQKGERILEMENHYHTEIARLKAELAQRSK